MSGIKTTNSFQQKIDSSSSRIGFQEAAHSDGLCKSNLVNWTTVQENFMLGLGAKDSLQLHMALSLLHNLLLVRSSDCCFGESLQILQECADVL